MRRIAFWLSLVLPALAVAGGAWYGSFPLGVRGEWEWARIEPTGSLSLSLVPPLVAALLYIGYVWLGTQRLERCGRSELAAWLTGLSLAGFTWLWVVQEAAPETFQLSKAAWVLYFRGSSGYFSEASEKARDLHAYLAGYEAEMGKGDVLHIGTHPPGLVIVFRCLLAACEASPALTEHVLATEPDSVQESFAELARTARHVRDPLPRADQAVLWLAALLVQAAAALTVVPLFGLLRRTLSWRASWLATAFWPTAPALAIFIPKSDCVYPFLALGFLWLWLTGLDRRSRGLCLLAGMALWMSLLFSLAFLPVIVLALLMSLRVAWRAGTEDGAPGPAGKSRTGSDVPLEPETAIAKTFSGQLRTLLRPVAWVGSGLIAPCIAAWWFLSLNLPAVWWLNFRNHAGFYRNYPRTYWKWLLVNPIEFAVAAGVPLAVLAGWAIVQARRSSSGRLPLPPHTWAWLATMCLLWMSGKNMGEAARLWIPFMPFVAWAVGPLFGGAPRSGIGSLRAERGGEVDAPDGLWRLAWEWPAALAVQMATTIAIVTRVGGFHYP